MSYLPHMNHDETLRSAYAAFLRGDLDGYLAHCTPDIQFTVPGRNRLAKTYTRDEFGPELITAVMTLTGGSFRETVLDVFTSDRGGVVYAEHELTRDGRPFTFRTMHLYDIVDGKLASFREIPENPYVFDEAWG